MTDLFQFVLKMGMVILLAILAVNAVGGIDALKSQITALDAASGQSRFAAGFLSAAQFGRGCRRSRLCVYLAVNWWATWYPGAEPGGGGYVAQRIFSAKNERHGVLATLWFNVAHYALRPWPWILTALATIVLYPNLADKEAGYIKVLMDPAVFPTWLRGFMIAAFAAAYMSTIGTQLNWGASYVINDFYRRFLVRDASERHYVVASQIATVLLMVLSLIVTFYLVVDRIRLEAVDGDRRRHRHGAAAAVVLVADQCLVGNLRDDRRRGRLALPAIKLRATLEQRRSAAICLLDAHDGGNYDGCVAGRHIADAARTARKADCFLSPRASGRARLGDDCRQRPAILTPRPKASACSSTIGSWAAC